MRDGFHNPYGGHLTVDYEQKNPYLYTHVMGSPYFLRWIDENYENPKRTANHLFENYLYAYWYGAPINDGKWWNIHHHMEKYNYKLPLWESGYTGPTLPCDMFNFFIKENPHATRKEKENFINTLYHSMRVQAEIEERKFYSMSMPPISSGASLSSGTHPYSHNGYLGRGTNSVIGYNANPPPREEPPKPTFDDIISITDMNVFKQKLNDYMKDLI